MSKFNSHKNLHTHFLFYNNSTVLLCLFGGKKIKMQQLQTKRSLFINKKLLNFCTKSLSSRDKIKRFLNVYTSFGRFKNYSELYAVQCNSGKRSFNVVFDVIFFSLLFVLLCCRLLVPTSSSFSRIVIIFRSL